MLLSEIIEMVDGMVPNSLKTEIKINFINQIQNQLYRDYPMDQAAAVFTIQSGLQFYPLPDDCPEDRLEHVTIGLQPYPFFAQGDNPEILPEHFCSLVIGQLMISPMPTSSGEKGLLYYMPRPKKLTISDMNSEPAYPSDFHEVLMWGLAMRVALTDTNTAAMSGTYEAKYLQLAEKADLKLTRKRQTQVSRVRDWS